MRTSIIALFFALMAPLASGAAGAQSVEEGQGVFETNCVMCHQRPEPKMLKFSQWKLVVGVMQKRMVQDGVEPLEQNEFDSVLMYLEKKARK